MSLNPSPEADAHGALERARSRQPADSARIDIVGPRHISHRCQRQGAVTLPGADAASSCGDGQI
jgi:hypothetical protein